MTLGIAALHRFVTATMPALAMLEHLDDQDRGRLDADICIIGAGAVGITLARALSRSRLQVVVLESGTESPDDATQALYSSSVVGLGHGGIHEYRARVFGGSTTRWGGQTLPLMPIDFEERPWVHGSGWPISHADLEPYYRQVGRMIGVPLRADDPWPGALAKPPAWAPELIEPLFSQFIQRRDFAKAYGKELAAAPNVRVVLGANVTQLGPDPANSAVDVATARSLRGASVDFTARHFVLCVGGIENARLLLASTSRADEGIGNGSGLVGRYFQDHPGFLVGEITLEPRARECFRPVRDDGVMLLPLFRAADDLQRREHLLNCGGSVVFHLSQSPAIHAGKVVLRAARTRSFDREARNAVRTVVRDPLPLLRAAHRYVVRGQPAIDASGPGILALGCEQAPNADSRVSLSASERDELGMPRVVLDWRLTEAEIRSIRVFAQTVASEVERLGLGRVDLDGFTLPDDPSALAGLVTDAGHHIGTTRMGATPQEGVVDPTCKVFGVENLYVGGSSVFPTGGFSNPTLTALALARRVADAISKDLGAPL